MHSWSYGRGGRVGILAALLALMMVGRAPAETNDERRFRLLEEKLEKAQQEIKELRDDLKQQRALSTHTQKQTEEVAQAAKLSLPDWINKFTIFGDTRFRFEGFYHQPHVEDQDVTARNRERIRARLGVRFAYSDELYGTIRAASGNINDPISTNETLGGNFNRKNFNLDWAFFTFTPGQSFNIRPGVFSLTAGKFPNPFFRTDEMVFDEDLSLEGVSETFQFLDKPRGPLDQVKLHLEEWTFDEVANAADGWMFGGQIDPTWHFGNVQFEAGLGQYYWLNANLIAQSLSKNTTAFTSTGAPVANPNFNSSLVNTNLLIVKNIQPPTPAGGKKPAAFTAITGYQSGFNQTNLVMAGTVPNVLFNQPLKLWADYVNNWQAAGHNDGFGWTTGVKLGQVKTRGDWDVFAFYEYLGQEAAISSFTFSDFGTGGTNVQGPGVGVEYQLLNPFTVAAKSYFTNYINTPQGSTNPTQTRFQLDLGLKF